MFIRVVKKQRPNSDNIFYQYTLAQSSRIAGKVKQRAILYLGSEKLMADKNNRDIVLLCLKAKIYQQPSIIDIDIPDPLEALAEHYYQKYLIKYGDHPEKGLSVPPAPDRADFHNVDLKGIDVENARTYGAENLCKQVLGKLELKKFFTSLGFSEKHTAKALISIAARALFSSSEHKTVQYLTHSSELMECFSYHRSIDHRQLYSMADKLYSHKREIDAFLYGHLTNIFNLKNKLVIFDISNTYFETSKRQSQIARYSKSKEKRSDCPLVVFTGVINEAGFIRHSKIYQGNKADTQTMEDMIDELEKYSLDKVDKTIVIDAGIATEDNLAYIHSKGYKYVCVSRKRLKDYTIASAEKQVIKLTHRGKNEVKLSIFHPEGYDDTWMYVQSDAKRKKEASMDEKLCDWYEKELETVKEGIHKKGGTKTINKVWKRIGRVVEKNKRVSGQYKIEVEEKNGVAIKITWKKQPKPQITDKTKGVYFIRTNHEHTSESQLWDIYNTIREVESTFRCLKSDLKIRPIHHQNDERIESHIYLTILAYQLINTIRHMLKEQNITHDWNNIIRIMNTQKIQSVILPTQSKDIHLRLPSKPIQEAKAIYDATGCTNTQTAKTKYVVYH